MPDDDGCVTERAHRLRSRAHQLRPRASPALANMCKASRGRGLLITLITRVLDPSDWLQGRKREVAPRGKSNKTIRHVVTTAHANAGVQWCLCFGLSFRLVRRRW